MTTNAIADHGLAVQPLNETTRSECKSLDDLTLFEQKQPSHDIPNGRTVESEVKQPIEQRSIVRFRWFLVCFATFSANLLYGLDTTIAADLQGAVSTTMNNITQLGWLGVGFPLGSTVAILPIGKAYSMFDTKWLFIGSLVNFAAGSALCGAAPTMAALIVGRVWAGVGGAGMYLGTINLMAALTSPTEKALFFALEVSVYGVGCILGPIVGGLLADSAATWRWAFYLNLVVFGAMAPVCVFVIPAVPRQSSVSIMDKIRKFDWIGIVLNAAIYVCLVLAFSFGGIIWRWSDGRFIALVVLFVLFTIAFAIQQHFAFCTNKVDRLFPCEFLGNLEMVILYIAMAASIAPFFVATYYIPLYFLFVHGDSGTETAVRLLPLVFVYVASILFAGYALQRVGYRMVWYFISGLFLVAGGAGMYTIRADTQPSFTYGFSVLIGIGLTVSQSGYGLSIALVEPHRIPDAMQFMNIAQGSAVLFGLVIANPIFQNEAFTGLKNLLADQGFSDAQIHAAVAGSRSQVLESISAELRKKALDVIVHAIQLDWILVIVGGATITIASLFLTKKRF